MINHPTIRRDLAQMRVDEFVRDAELARRARSLRDSGRARAADVIVIREAVQADEPALAQLAELAGEPVLTGPVVVGSVRGVVRAAVAMDGRGLADLFVPTADVMDLVRIRARQLCATYGDCVDAARFSPRRLIHRRAALRH
jgi:hypothetical protein